MKVYLRLDHLVGWTLTDDDSPPHKEVELDPSFLARMVMHMQEHFQIQKELEKLNETSHPA